MSYNPYTQSLWSTYLWSFMRKEKPNVGYWPKGRSTSGLTPSLWTPSHPTVYASVREAEENFAYHRHQQHMVDEFRAKPHFANRIRVPSDDEVEYWNGSAQ